MVIGWLDLIMMVLRRMLDDIGLDWRSPNREAKMVHTIPDFFDYWGGTESSVRELLRGSGGMDVTSI